jgi:hypothetical protein
MLLGKGEIELKSVGQILRIVHLWPSTKVEQICRVWHCQLVTNLSGGALDKISLLSDFRSGLKFPFTVQAALGWELSAGRTQSVPVLSVVTGCLSDPPILAARSPIQKGKSRVEFQADRHKVPMRTSHWWGEPQSQQDLAGSNVIKR